MNDREQRGLALAALYRIDKKPNGKWLVPSQSGNGTTYEVDPEQQHCTCPDHQDRKIKCKHMFAVEFVQTREKGADGSVTITRSFKLTERVTYKQDWPNYNKAQCQEKRLFQSILADLCRGVPEPARRKGKPGRKPFTLADMTFAVAFKVYSTVSTRRFTCDLEEAVQKGLVERAPHYNTVCEGLEDARLTPVLKSLIVESSKPLAAVEAAFAVDSSGFSTCRFTRWFDIKYGKTMEERDWVKVHLITGTKTNVVTAVVIEDKNAADTVHLPALLKTTCESFNVKELSGDAVYATENNFQALANAGVAAYLTFKDNTTGGIGGLFEKAFHYFCAFKDDFLAHYHKRSNVESTFSMIKGKFGDSVRSKGDVAMVNETLCKILCHNICCLIHAIFELGIEAKFWGEAAEQERVPVEANGQATDDIEALAWV